MTTRACTKCGDEKVLSDFSFRRDGRDGRHSWCRPCTRDKDRSYNRKNPHKYREAGWSRQGIDINWEGYAQMLDDRDGCCDICKGEFGTKLSVDHCHDTGLIRGLLCNQCNRGIGLLGDNIETVRSALEYLENPPC